MHGWVALSMDVEYSRMACNIGTRSDTGSVSAVDTVGKNLVINYRMAGVPFVNNIRIQI